MIDRLSTWKRIALAVGLMAIAACNNQSDDDRAEPQPQETAAAKPAPKTDADGNESISEGPTDDATPYSIANAGHAASANTAPPSAPAQASRPAAPRPRATKAEGPSAAGPAAPQAPASRPTQGSKLLKADPQ